MMDIHEKMRKALDALVEAEMGAALYGGHTSTAANSEGEPLTLAALEKLMQSMPPRETWATSRLFPRGHATLVKAPDENLTLINSDDWQHWRRELRQQSEPWASEERLLGFVEPMELDPHETDSAETAKWRASERQRIMGVMVGTIAAEAGLESVMRKARKLPPPASTGPVP